MDTERGRGRDTTWIQREGERERHHMDTERGRERETKEKQRERERERYPIYRERNSTTLHISTHNAPESETFKRGRATGREGE